jgi:hypothetical protein
MLFHRGLGKLLPFRFGQPKHFDIGGDVQRLHIREFGQSPALAPVRKLAGGLVVCPPQDIFSVGFDQRKLVLAKPLKKSLGLRAGKNKERLKRVQTMYVD